VTKPKHAIPRSAMFSGGSEADYPSQPPVFIGDHEIAPLPPSVDSQSKLHCTVYFCLINICSKYKKTYSKLVQYTNCRLSIIYRLL